MKMFMRFLTVGSLAALLFISAQLVPAIAATFEVTGVEAWDVLNIRARPRLNAAIVGGIPPGAGGVEVLGNSPNGWARISYRDRFGYVPRRFLRVAQGYTPRPLPTQMACHGTEPFWSLALTPGRAVFDNPEAENRSFSISALQTSANRPDVSMAESRSGPLRLSVYIAQARACSNGMSDEEFPYETSIRLSDDRVFSGCCK
jgi:uncharacterized membrane protein